jgi:hypothetical protein
MLEGGGSDRDAGCDGVTIEKDDLHGCFFG